MNEEISHEDYIRIYKELIDWILYKEDIIEKMTRYIDKHSEKTNSMCKISKIHNCSKEQCLKCIRKYFERGFYYGV